MRLTRVTLAIAIALAAPRWAGAGTPSAADPEGAGFSAAWLGRITTWYRAQIDAGALPGAVVAIARNGRLAFLQAIGSRDRARTVPLQPDAIFQIASMTKPVTSVAAMMLVEDGKLDLSAPVDAYLPELKGMRVGIERKNPATGEADVVLEEAKRPMTVRDLLRHTAGLTYPEEDSTAMHRLYRRAAFTPDATLAEFVTSLAKLPLVHQPGEVWEYSWGDDVLARVVEVASGQSFDRFLEDRLFKPLGMVDTGFYVPVDKLARLVDLPPGGRPEAWDVSRRPRLFSGGGGLLSTAPDYLRFCQMLLNGGERDGVRILRRDTVAQMTANSLPAGVRFAGAVGAFVGPAAGSSWGLGFAIRTDPRFSGVPGGLGSFGWGGIWGTTFWIDPVHDLIAVEMIQVEPAAAGAYARALRHLTYAALRVPDDDRHGAPAEPISASAETLVAFAGSYAFGPSLSSRDVREASAASAAVGMEIALEGGEATVATVFAGGPAAKAGILQRDVVADIDDVPVIGLSLGQLHRRLNGPADRAVRLKIVRNGAENPIDFAIVRRPVRSPDAAIDVRVGNGALLVEATGPWSVLDFEKGRSTPVQAISGNEFYVEGGEHTRIAFTRNQAGEVVGAVLNPGRWQIVGDKVN